MTKKDEIKTLSLKEQAEAEMQSLVEQHNALVQEIQESSNRLTEVKSMIVEKQGYMKGLADCDAECEKGDK